MKLRIFSLLMISMFFSNFGLANEINPSLLTPNITPGNQGVGDINRTRQYYDALKKSPQKLDDDLVGGEDDNLNDIKLPEKIIESAPSVLIKKVVIGQSEIFTEQEIEKFKSLIENKWVTAEDLNNFLNVINTQYIKNQTITAKAYYPIDALHDGILSVELIEGRIGQIAIENNKYTRSFFIRSYISQNEGDVLHLGDLQEDLQRFNLNARGSKVTAKLKAGEEFGTTDVTLVADENFPVHMSVPFDNFGSESTGNNRFGMMLYTDNIFGIQDRFSLGANWSSSSRTTFVDYNLPINTQDTRIGISYVNGKSDIRNGIFRDYDISSRNNAVSLYVTHPFIRTARTSFDGNLSLNNKNTKSDIYQINYTNIRDTNLNLGLGYRYRWNDAFISFTNNLTSGYIKNKIIDDKQFFWKYNSDLLGIRYFDNGAALIGRLSVQYLPQEVPFVQQAQIGGMSTVRGYQESLLMGESSYLTSIEALLPLTFLPKETVLYSYEDPAKEDIKFNFKDNIKFALFVDHGAVFRHGFTSTKENFITGLGAGFRISLNNYVQSRVYWGYAVDHKKLNVPASKFNFELSVSLF